MSYYDEQKEKTGFPVPDRYSKYGGSFAPNHFAQGATRYAYKGVCNENGPNFQFGDKLVVKKFIEKHAMSAKEWDGYFKTEQLAKDLAKAWNQEASGFVNKTYTVCTSELQKVATSGWCSKYSGHEKHAIVGEFVTIERWLGDNFEKWNSNTGFATQKSSSVHAFCHWTYHVTDGQYLFCDAQGCEKKYKYCISDPCILSQTSGEFGMTDIGSAGIGAWFSRHECNEYCDSSWLKPSYNEMRAGRETFPSAIKGTTYTWNVRNNASKTAKNTMLNAITEDWDDDDDYW